jgi:hypothetical protein
MDGHGHETIEENIVIPDWDGEQTNRGISGGGIQNAVEDRDDQHRG